MSIEVSISVVSASPKRLSIVRVVSTSVALFGAVVNNRNANSSNYVGQSVLISHVIRVGVQESLVIMIIDEGAQDGQIRKSSFV